MQVTVECLEPSRGSTTAPKFQHVFDDRRKQVFRCGLERPLDPEKILQWRSTRGVRKSMSPVRERDDTLKKKLLNEADRSISSEPSPFTKSRVLSSGLSISSCGNSSAGDTTPASQHRPRSGSSGTGPGLSTELSSVCSWRYDEFEQVNTQHVRQLFNSVDELLYEGRVSRRSEALLEECEEWNGHTPHLRILGNQLEPPKLEGVQFICRPASSGRASSLSAASGHSLAVGLSCEPSMRSSSSPLPQHVLHTDEEVYEAEGSIEEFLAYHRKEVEDEEADQRKSSFIAPRSGVPPVSPHACIRDAVADELFDDVWREVLELLEELVHKYWEKQLPDQTRIGLDSSSELPLPPLPLKAAYQLLSSRASSRSTFQSSCSNNLLDSSAYKLNLNGVMTIQAKPLLQRHPGFGERTPCEVDDGPNVLMCVKSPALRGCGSLNQKPTVLRKLPRLGSRVRIHQNLIGNGSQLLRGTRLSTVNETLASPPVSGLQNHRLPQINSESPEQEYSSLGSRLAQLKGKIGRGGLTPPAVNNLPPLREPTLMLESMSRPNTTSRKHRKQLNRFPVHVRKKFYPIMP
ncbi:hypothetical protein DNTS_022790 [Danionella cerebrum]|uniref:DUF3719 domain-containing protein n=1 Tax=Danionella cerebrum TaxID=2873325 RepID=A0A553MTN9_9TELE|nr:hypothetical protein DNTS_022790 [Danionella translucida]